MAEAADTNEQTARLTYAVRFAVAALLAAAWSAERRQAIGLALIVGIAMAWASVASSPPLPPVPKSPYDPVKQPLDMCRPVFRGT